MSRDGYVTGDKPRRTKIHPDQAEVIDDAFYAAYIHYLGYPIMKCSTGTSTVWTFLIAVCDVEIMKDEFESDQPIQVKSYSSAVKRVFSFQKLARDYTGEYVTQEWRDALRREAEVIRGN